MANNRAGFDIEQMDKALVAIAVQGIRSICTKSGPLDLLSVANLVLWVWEAKRLKQAMEVSIHSTQYGVDEDKFADHFELLDCDDDTPESRPSGA